MQNKHNKLLKDAAIVAKWVRVAVIVVAGMLAINSWQRGTTLLTLLFAFVMVLGFISLWRSVVRWNSLKNKSRR